MRKILLMFIVLAFISSSCEKDDICDANTPTTPRLIIDFFDISNPGIAKSVTNLAIVGEGLSPIKFNGVSKIQVPLNTSADISKYSFILNYGNTDPSLIYTDLLEFNYSRSTVYVSRACGYKILFNLNNDISLPNAFVLNNDSTASEGVWIKNITVTKYNLESENETHLKIYF